MSLKTKNRKRQLQFRFRYTPAVAEEIREFDPVLHCYISQNVKNVTPFVQEFSFKDSELMFVNRPQKNSPSTMKDYHHGLRSQRDTKKWYNNIEFDQQAKFQWFCDNSDNASEDLKIDRDTTINFDAFTHTYNKKGEKCLNEAGSCSLFLYELYYYLSQDPDKILYLKKPLLVYNADMMFKGLVYMEIDSKMISDIITVTQSSIAPSISLDIDQYQNEGVVKEKALKRDAIFKAASHYDYIGDNKKVFDETFKNYIISNYFVWSKENSRPTWKFMSNIHSPMYSFRGFTLPALCYVLMSRDPRSRNSEKYYINLLEIAIRRHYPDKTLNEAMDYFINAAQDSEVAVIHAKLICLFSNYCKYMTDKVQITPKDNITKEDMSSEFKYMNEKHDQFITLFHKSITKKENNSNNKIANSFLAFEDYDDEYKMHAKSILENQKDEDKSIDANVSRETATKVNEFSHVKLIESFSVWLRMTFTGDCEDMGREILRHDYDIKTSEFTHPGLQRLQQIRREYFALQTLKGVSSAAVTDDIDELKEMNAHMDITLIPARHCINLMKNFNSSVPLFEEADTLYVDRERKEPLPVLICEGTGILNPDSSEPPNQACKAYLMKDFQNSFKDIRSTIYQNLKEQSGFYKTIQSALVYDFIDAGYGVGEIVFYQNHDPKGTSLKKNKLFADNKNRKNTNGLESYGVIDFGQFEDEDEEEIGKEMAPKVEHFDDVCGKHGSSHKKISHIANSILKDYHSESISGSIENNSQRPTHGIRHVDLINQNVDDIMIYTMPEITKDELEKFRRVLQHNHPVPAMDAPEYTASQWYESRGKIGNIYLEKLCAVARKQKRNYAFIKKLKYVDFYLREDQVTEERCNEWIRLVQEKKYVIGVDYYSEQLTDKHRNFLLRFTCVPVRMF